MQDNVSICGSVGGAPTFSMSLPRTQHESPVFSFGLINPMQNEEAQWPLLANMHNQTQEPEAALVLVILPLSRCNCYIPTAAAMPLHLRLKDLSNPNA